MGCGLEQCGACTVLLGSRAIRSCKTSVIEATRGRITTLEGLSTPEELHPIQRAFLDEQAAQCGYCTSGMIMVVAQLLGKITTPRMHRSALHWMKIFADAAVIRASCGPPIELQS